jgi:UDP-GlcNAc:undecaprenyl-phosphate GlcNAc-1-phosphate transferase
MFLALRYKRFVCKGIPLTGGIAVALGFCAGCIVGWWMLPGAPSAFIGILCACLAMLALGLIDDVRELSVLHKFTVQLIAATLLIAMGTRTHIVFFSTPLNIVLTYLWLLGITNAFNHLDVMDGVAGGIGVLVSCGFMSVALYNADAHTAIAACALAAALSVFLLFNIPPARVYLGNGGSHFLGFFLGALALHISYAPLERPAALCAPLLILGVPLLDTAFLVFMRTHRKILPFYKSNDHLVLRLRAAGCSRPRALGVMLLWGLICAFSGVAVSQSSNTVAAVISAGMLLVSAVLLIAMSRVRVDA